MKKIYFLLLAMFTLSASKAQYFEHNYGNNVWDSPEKGMNTLKNREGFIISGINRDSLGAERILVSYADKTGNIPGSPFFSKTYRLNTPSGTPTNARDAKVIELDSLSFGVAGATHIIDNGINYEYVYYLQLDASGVPLAYSLYTVPSSNYYEVNSIALSANLSAVYFTGLATDTISGESRIFVIKTAFNGSLIWSHTYDLDSTTNITDPLDLMEDPLRNELMVVGGADYYDSSGDGFLLRLNPGNGSVIDLSVYGGYGNSDSFTAIIGSNDATNNYGYVIAGYTDATPGTDFDGWLIKLDSSFNQTWSNIYDYNYQTTNNFFADVTERLNNNSVYEYYAGGITNSGVLGSADMEVDKIDINGNSVSQFTYGTSYSDALVSIDKNDTGVKGLSMFGYSSTGSIGNSDLTIFKSYYNGVTSCDYYIDSIMADRGPEYIETFYPDSVDVFVMDSTSLEVVKATERDVCYDSLVGDGDNKLVTIAQPEQHSLINIITAPGTNSYTIELDNAEAGKAVIALRDIFGREVYSFSVETSNGKNSIPFSLNTEKMCSGIYILNVSSKAGSKSKKINVIK